MPAFVVPQSGITGNLGEDLQDFATDAEESEETPVDADLRDGSKHVSDVAEGSDINAGSVSRQSEQNEMVRIFLNNDETVW